MTTAEGPCFPTFTRAEAVEIAGALTECAYECRQSDPARSGRLHDHARKIQRHVFAVRPLVYRPGPVDVVVEMANRDQMVAKYAGTAP